MVSSSHKVVPKTTYFISEEIYSSILAFSSASSHSHTVSLRKLSSWSAVSTQAVWHRVDQYQLEETSLLRGTFGAPSWHMVQCHHWGWPAAVVCPASHPYTLSVSKWQAQTTRRQYKHSRPVITADGDHGPPTQVPVIRTDKEPHSHPSPALLPRVSALADRALLPRDRKEEMSPHFSTNTQNYIDTPD